MWATYIDDFVGVANRHFIGVDKLMWSSDYPHQASSWPHSQEVVARDFKEASADDRLQDHPRQRRQALRFRTLGIRVNPRSLARPQPGRGPVLPAAVAPLPA